MDLSTWSDETKQALEMLTHLYTSVEDGKAVITSFSMDQPTHEITTFDSSYSKYVKSGPVRVTIEAEVWPPNK
jgi:hypothetical protein